MNAKIPKINITSRNDFVSKIMEMIAIPDIRFTPIMSKAMTRSGKLGPMIIRYNVIAIATPKSVIEAYNMA